MTDGAGRELEGAFRTTFQTIAEQREATMTALACLIDGLRQQGVAIDPQKLIAHLQKQARRYRGEGSAEKARLATLQILAERLDQLPGGDEA